MIRFGGGNYAPTGFATVNAAFLATGTIVGFAIIIPAVLVTYLLGGSVSILELIINLIGGVLFLLVGGLAISHNTRIESKLQNI